MSLPVIFNILEWNYSHISIVMEDWAAHVLDFATQRSSTLVSLVVNTSLLAEIGLAKMQQVLKRSDLQFLSIECGAFDSSLENHLGQVLDSVT